MRFRLIQHPPFSMLTAASLLFSPVLFAAETPLWNRCTDNSIFTQQLALPQLDNAEQIDISALKVSTNKNRTSLFEGDVLVENQAFRLTTEKLIYNQSSETMQVPQAMELQTENLLIKSKSGHLDIKNNTSEFSLVDYLIPANHMQGKSERIEQQQSQRTILYDTYFSSCPPGKESWKLSTSELNLDHEDQSGSGRHVVIRLGDVPIFYLPYISFPLGEHRRSGILTPEIKLTTSRNGYEFDLPYYWNIAPNQDATITPHYMQERGLQLQGQYRYLTQSSEGQIDIEYLDNDALTDEQRHIAHFINKTNITSQLRFDVDVRDASDSQYLADFGDSLDLSSVTHLQRKAVLSYTSGGYQSQLSSLAFETIDDTILPVNRPYRHLPRLTVNGGQELVQDGLRFDVDAEWVDFRHEDPTKISGNRLHLHPKFSWPLGGSYWFTTPALGYQHTRYELTQGDLTPITIEDRNLPVFSLDSGLFFERKAGGEYTQTLEPRLFYLNIPFEDQSAIPLFDTTEPDFSFSQLFKENRFIGNDRVADANQLTLAVTTRFLNNHDGRETFTASIGQIQYFDDREISLNETTGDTQTSKQSDIVAELTANTENSSYQMTLLQNTESNEIDKGNLLWHYMTDNRHIYNFGYRFRRDATGSANDQEEGDISFKWPLLESGWSAIAKWNYSLSEEKTQEQMAGFEYDSCCWAFRLVGRGYLTEDENNEEIFDKAVIFTLVLKGLGSTGEANRKLERAIIGFEPEY